MMSPVDLGVAQAARGLEHSDARLVIGQDLLLRGRLHARRLDFAGQHDRGLPHESIM